MPTELDKPASDHAPNRRWFRFSFSLRTVFVVVTVFAGWLGWEVHVVIERRELARALRDQGGAVVISVAEFGGADSAILRSPQLRISPVRKLLGDEAYLSIDLQRETFSEEQARQYQKVFSEAVVSWMDPVK